MRRGSGGRRWTGLRLLVGAGALALAAGCSEKEKPLQTLAPKPLPTLPVQPSAPSTPEEREALHTVKPAEVLGEAIPGAARQIALAGTRATVSGKSFEVEDARGAQALVTALGDGPVVLAPDADTYLAQASALLAALDDAGRAVWLLHPAGQVAYPLVLRDEDAFRAWMEEPKPGKLRVILRADGYELMTNVGKLLGGDPNGPSVPVRGGQLDVLGLRQGMTLLRGRFGDAKDACIVPTFGTELRKVGASLSGFYAEAGKPIFPETCLIYPRPRSRSDAGH